MPAALSGGGRLDVGRRRRSLAWMRYATLGVLPVVGLVIAGFVSAAAPGAATVNEKAERGQAIQVGEPPPRPPVPVEALQAKINELFTPYGTAPLTVDGDLGRYTRQRVCAFRLAAGLPVSTSPIAPGSAEEDLLMSTPTLPTPFTSAILSERWVLVDLTCQMMFIGSGAELVFVFPTSTGSTGFETRHQNRTPTYMYRSASHNNGWHDSSQYPVGDDNPLNGNMYKPLYFDRGLAIHGANYVPFYPASKGCTRLRVHDMNRLISWLGLGDVTGTIVSTSRLNATVNVQGHWAG